LIGDGVSNISDANDRCSRAEFRVESAAVSPLVAMPMGSGEASRLLELDKVRARRWATAAALMCA